MREATAALQPYHAKLSSACSEIMEDLLRKTFDEENPFERFKEKEDEEAEGGLDGGFMHPANSFTIQPQGDAHERKDYVSQCLHSIVSNNQTNKGKRAVEDEDEDNFDSEYLEELRGGDVVAETDSDKDLPDEIFFSPRNRYKRNGRIATWVAAQKMMCTPSTLSSVEKINVQVQKSLPVLDSSNQTDFDRSSAIQTDEISGADPVEISNQTSDLRIMCTRSTHVDDDDEKGLMIFSNDNFAESLGFSADGSLQMGSYEEDSYQALNEIEEMLLMDDGSSGDWMEMDDIYGQGDGKMLPENTVTVEVTFGFCARLIAIFLTLNTLLLLKYLIIDVMYCNYS